MALNITEGAIHILWSFEMAFPLRNLKDGFSISDSPNVRLCEVIGLIFNPLLYRFSHSGYLKWRILQSTTWKMGFWHEKLLIQKSHDCTTQLIEKHPFTFRWYLKICWGLDFHMNCLHSRHWNTDNIKLDLVISYYYGYVWSISNFPQAAWEA